MRFFFTTIVFLLITTPGNTQWIMQNSDVTQNLYDIEFLDNNTGWAVGDGGTIVKTTNGGINWMNIPNPAIGKPLSSIHIVNKNVAYVVGWFETIIKTTDGGSSWIVIRNWTGSGLASYEGVFFLNENTGWFAGTGQKVIKTTDGGQTLDSIYIDWGTLWDIYFKDANTGIISATGNLFKTTNGGINWTEANIPLGGSFPFFRKLSVVNDSYCWMVSHSRRVFRSTDFGSNWNILDTIETQSSIIGVEFGSIVTGWAGGDFGNLYKTIDGGYSWHLENTLGDQRFWASLTFKDSLLGWGCGGNGKIFHTTNGGQTAVSIPNNSYMNQEYILNQNYPNPFNPSTNISYSLPYRGYVNISVYDITGKLVQELISENQTAGNYIHKYINTRLSSGIYYYVLKVDGDIKSLKKMAFIK